MNGKKFYYHNELYFRVPRPIKRRLMEICREKNTRPNDLLCDITTRYVFDNTPNDPLSQKIVEIKNWFSNNRRQLYNTYVGILFMMIGALFIFSMSKITESVMFTAIFFTFVVIILVFAKIFFILGKIDYKRTK